MRVYVLRVSVTDCAFAPGRRQTAFAGVCSEFELTLLPVVHSDQVLRDVMHLPALASISDKAQREAYERELGLACV